MKNLQVLKNKDTNKIIKQAAWEVEQAAQETENLIFLIDLATVAMVAEYTKPTKDEPHTFNKAWNYPNAESQRKW